MLVKTVLFGLLVGVAISAPAPSPFLGTISNALTDSFGTVKDGFGKLSTPITETVTGIPSSVGEVTEAVTTSGKTVFTSATTGGKKVGGAVGSLIGTTIKVPAKMFSNGMTLLGTFISNGNQLGKNVVTGGSKLAKATATAAGKTIETGGNIAAAGVGAVEGLVKGGMSIGDKVNAMAVDTVNKYGTSLNKGVTAGFDKGAELVKVTSDTANDFGNKLANKVTDLTKTVDTEVKGVVNTQVIPPVVDPPKKDEVEKKTT